MPTRAAEVSLALVFVICFASQTKAVETKSSASPQLVTTSTGPAKQNLNMKALHRLDFIVKGSSCPACLLKIQKRMEAAPGVAQAAIMLNRPYGGVCIYDSSKIDKTKVLVLGKSTEKKVTFEQQEDAAINKLPVILIPHHAMDPQN